MNTSDKDGFKGFQQPISRRQFLKMGGVLTVSLLAQGIPGFALKSFAATPETSTANKLIVIFLRGAVDGLSILAPYSEDDYYGNRPNIAISKPGSSNGLIALDERFGLNPNLAMLMPYWEKRQLAFVTCAGSPDPTRSHFDAQDFMESGTPSVKGTDTGWLNRFLQVMPNNQSPMRGINVGTNVPRIYQGPISVSTISTSMNPLIPMALDNPNVAGLFKTMYTDDPMLGNAYDAGLKSRESMLAAFKAELLESAQGAPAGSEFNKAGGLIARLIKDDPKVQSVFVSLGAWDTHVNQGNAAGSLAGQLKGLGDGLATMMSTLEANGNLDNTTIMIMSEFGRTVKENGNKGTDHGHANLIWLLGGTVNGRQIGGSWSGLNSDNLFEGRDIPVTTDFRAVAMDMLKDRYGFNGDQLRHVFPNAGNVVTAVKQPLFRPLA
jgi:uncharacterized protein (DUF1501 family)